MTWIAKSPTGGLAGSNRRRGRGISSAKPAWLRARFSRAERRDVEGLVKRVNRAEIEAHDWSLTPGRYVGVAPEEEGEDFDFEEALRSIHSDLQGLNEEAVLAARIARSFEELGA